MQSALPLRNGFRDASSFQDRSFAGKTIRAQHYLRSTSPLTDWQPEWNLLNNMSTHQSIGSAKLGDTGVGYDRRHGNVGEGYYCEFEIFSYIFYWKQPAAYLSSVLKHCRRKLDFRIFIGVSRERDYRCALYLESFVFHHLNEKSTVWARGQEIIQQEFEVEFLLNHNRFVPRNRAQIVTLYQLLYKSEEQYCSWLSPNK